MNSGMSEQNFHDCYAMRYHIFFIPRWIVQFHVAEKAGFQTVSRWPCLLGQQFLIRDGCIASLTQHNQKLQNAITQANLVTSS